MPRAAVLSQAFVELADTLVHDFDIVDVLTVLADRCLDVLDVEAAGVAILGPDDEPRLVASSSEAMPLAGTTGDEGPILECWRSGMPVTNQEVARMGARWPSFAEQARAGGFITVHAFPMRLSGTAIGVLQLCNTEVGLLSPGDIDVAQGLADVATIAILQQRSAPEAEALAEQLKRALDSHIAVERAIGIVAETEGCAVDQAFEMIRDHARLHDLRLSDVADAITASGAGRVFSVRPPDAPGAPSPPERIEVPSPDEIRDVG